MRIPAGANLASETLEQAENLTKGQLEDLVLTGELEEPGQLEDLVLMEELEEQGQLVDLMAEREEQDLLEGLTAELEEQDLLEGLVLMEELEELGLLEDLTEEREEQDLLEDLVLMAELEEPDLLEDLDLPEPEELDLQPIRNPSKNALAWVVTSTSTVTTLRTSSRSSFVLRPFSRATWTRTRAPSLASTSKARRKRCA